MKSLTRLLLINWHYFDKTILDFGTINFLTGKNTAGKSTIIDALQVVLRGETRSEAFNRAANKKSSRTLESYLLGSMGEDIENGKKSIRDGKDFSTYIVAEFYDDFKAEYFCLGAVFDVYSDGGEYKKRFFELRSEIPKCHFIENEITMDSRRMRDFFKENYPNKFETRDTVEAYRELVLRRLNILDNKFFTMLKKSISFEPINDVEKFITQYVCDIEDNIDITEMRNNIYNYKMQEEMAQRFVLKLDKLSDIRNIFGEIQKLQEKEKTQQFLIDYSIYNDYLQKLQKANEDLEACNKDIENYNHEIEVSNQSINQIKKEKEALEAEKAKFCSDNNVEWLESEENRLKEDIEKNKKSIEDFILKLKTSSVRWKSKLLNSDKVIEDEIIKKNISRAVSFLSTTEKFCESDFENYSPKYFHQIRDSFNTVKNDLKPICYAISNEINEYKDKVQKINEQIEDLKKGIKPYPTKAENLKKAIHDGLKEKYNEDISVEYLADLIDVTDEEWHDAVEGYLNTQRMNIIVPPEYFMDAYNIYKKARNNGNIHEYAIVDLQKVYERNSPCNENSLAEVVTSEDKYVKSYINFLLGKVNRCCDDNKLRDYPTSVTKDCMLYHNYAVKSLNQDAYHNPYIGRSSVEKQIIAKNDELDKVQEELKERGNLLSSIEPTVNDEWFLTESFIDSAVVSSFAGYEDRKRLQKELEEIQNAFDRIDLLWLNDIEDKINNKETEIKDIQNKQEENKTNIIIIKTKKGELTNEKIPSMEKTTKEAKEKIDSKYTEEYQNTVGITKYQAEIAQRNNPMAIANKYDSLIKQTQDSISKIGDTLIEKRSEYNKEEQVSFKLTDILSNDEYEKTYNQIKDCDLPKYQKEIAKAKESAMEQFQSDFLYRLRSNINTASEKISDLNKALKEMKFGGDSYRFKMEPNPAYFEYYDMIMSPLLENGNVGLFSYDFTEKYQSVIDNLFAQIISMDEDIGKTAKNVELFSKYTTYLSFDMYITDANGRTSRLSKSMPSNSGGELQTPFYVAILASFAQLYMVNSYNENGNTARIVIFDEAFNNMDGERILESVNLLKKFGLQAIICSPLKNVSDIAPVANKTLLVYKEAVNGIFKSTVVEWSKDMEEEIGDTQ